MHGVLGAMLDSAGKEYRYAIQRRDIMSYAQAWLKWFPTIEQGATGLNERMLQLADLDHAETVLDIGTGIGERGAHQRNVDFRLRLL